jgi:hypothetical protein
MLDGPLLIRPFTAVIESIQNSNFARVVVQVVPDAAMRAQSEIKVSVATRVWRTLTDAKRRRQLFYKLFERIDRRNHPQLDGILGVSAVEPLLSGVSLLCVSPQRTGAVDRFSAHDIEAIRALNLDVLLRFGFGILRGEILAAARCGVWSFHHGDNAYYRGAPPQFWELYEGAELSGAMLQVLNESLDGGLVLGKVFAATTMGLSVLENRVAPYLSAELLALQKLKLLHEKSWDAVVASATPEEPYRGHRKIYRAPTNMEVAKYVGRYASRKFVSRAGKLLGKVPVVNQWRVGIRTKHATQPWEGKWDQWRWIKAPARHYYADPMLWEYDGRTYLFVEDYLEDESRGVLAVAEVGADGSVGDFSTILSRPFHLSFPYIFERDGAIFMMPESKAGNRIELFRATRFPFEWQSERVLMEVPAVDSLLHKHVDGREYLFTTIANRPGAQGALCVFHSASLFGDWQMHPASPISCDVRYSRNAGPLIIDPSLGLIRVSQDGSILYGRQMHFHHIERLNEYEYKESFLATRRPEDVGSPLGIHTYGGSSRWEVIDAFMSERAEWE